MTRGLVVALAAGLALGGCCHDIGSHVPHSSAQAQFHPASKPHQLKRSKPRIAVDSTVTPTDIFQSEDELSQSAIDALRKKLVICRGCEDPAPNDVVSAVWPTRAAEGYLSLQKTLRSLSLPEATSSGGPQ
jgi:hypothetical protein